MVLRQVADAHQGAQGPDLLRPESRASALARGLAELLGDKSVAVALTSA